MDEPITSLEQDDWVEIVENLRREIKRALPKVTKMSASDLNNFTDACNNVYQLDIRARTYDFKLQKEGLPFGDNGCP